ncbi:hypothetical protein GYA49_01265 [Candidatus Beckwithbacteria bacterium]|nr:hypothetical protein [Candidatus Beckwithbacteria bacterium]
MVAETAFTLPAFQTATSAGHSPETAMLHRQVSNLCDAVLAGLNNLPLHRGVDKLSQNIELCRALMNPPKEKNISSLPTKQRIAEERRTKKYTQARVTLQRQGLNPEEISHNELLIIVELSEAITSTYRLCEAVDPKLEREGGRQEISTENLGAKANIEFADFFIKIHQQFDLGQDELEGLFVNIFKNYDLKKAYQGRAMENFPIGILAALRAYLYLYEQKKGQGTFKLPTVEQDTLHAVDLIWEDEEGKIECYEIKSNPVTDEVELFNITAPEGAGKFQALLHKFRNPQAIKSRKSALERIQNYISQLVREGRQAEGFALMVPV